MSNGALTIEQLEKAYEKVVSRGYVAPAICLSQSSIDMMVRWQLHEKWINSHPKWKQKEIRLIERLRVTTNRKRKILPLPN